MANEHHALRLLLANELPLTEVGPYLRQAVRRALQADDPERLRLVGRAVVAELLRRGDLLRLVVEQPSSSPEPLRSLYLLKGANRIVDLTALGGSLVPIPPNVPPRPPANSVSPPSNLDSFGAGFSGVAGMLGAMEDAQDLEIGDLHSGERAVVVAGILRLLGKFTPQFRLFVILDEKEPLGDVTSGVYQVSAAEAQTHWLSARSAGQSVWIPAQSELPAAIRRELAGDVPDFTFAAAVAVPLWEPPRLGETEAEAVEAGLLFVVARDQWPREALLRLADRLTRFVTRRWQHQAEVNQRIHSDGLTGVFNRAYFDRQFTLELERARRSSVPLTLIVGDLDNFKLVNDTYGHDAGDQVLRMVARRMLEELRRIDHVCRTGGEEFAFILPDTSLDAAREVMARLLDAPFIEEVRHEGRLIPLRTTFSYGAVTFPAAGADALELYRKADQMLYLSKDLGRNRCHFWNSEGDHTQLLPSAGAVN